MVVSLFRDSPEYIKRTKTPFKPSQLTIAEVRGVVPKHLFERNTARGLLYGLRDITCALVFYSLSGFIDPFVDNCKSHGLPPVATTAIRWSLWALYWHFQGLAFTAMWCLSHEAGHGNVSPMGWVNDAVGFTLHTFLLTPYYAWRSTHHAHHKATMSLERDENYIPKTRSEFHLPPQEIATISNYHDLFDETPIYTLLRIFLMQAIGWHWYLMTNIMGNKSYPAGTNHFSPWSPLFKPHERKKIVASNIGLSVMATILTLWGQRVGFAEVFRVYLVPYLLTNHWIVMLTYLHHCDPTIPIYRSKEWSFLRGAISTVDRPLLGWAGRFFLHNVSHDHVAHHLFSNIPFYNQPMVTEAIKKILKDDYNFDTTNSFRALYRTFSQCCFIEDDGDVVFYKNKHGQAIRVLESDVSK